MSHSWNANYVAATASGALLPTYFIRIEGVDDKQFSTAPVVGATRDTRVLLEVPDSVGQVLDQLRGKSSLSITRVLLVDHNDDLTTILAVRRPASVINTTVNRGVTLFSGYADLDEADYEEIARGQISTLRLLPDEKTYELRILDEGRTQNEEIMTNAEATSLQKVDTRIVGGYSAGAEFISIEDINGVAQDEFYFIGPNANGDTEKIETRGVSGSQIRLLDVLQFNYENLTRFRWATSFLEGNPVNMIYSILSGNFADPLFPLDEVLGNPTGLDIDTARLVAADFIRERDNFYSDEVWRMEFKRSSKGLRTLERAFYRFLGYPYINLSGQMSFRMFRPPYAEDVAGLKQLGPEQIIRWRWERSHKLHVNRIETGVDYSPETGDAAFFEVIEDLQDQEDSKETIIIEEEGTGFISGLRGVRLSQERGEILLNRLNPPPEQLRIDVPLQDREIEVGQVVEITHPNIPNMETGRRGLDRFQFECVGRNESFGNETIDLLLQNANYDRPAFIASDVQSDDYDLATEAEREYAHIGKDTPTGISQLLLWTEAIDNPVWVTNPTFVTVTPNVVVAPDGETTGDLIQYVSDHGIFNEIVDEIATDRNFTGSIYLKAPTGHGGRTCRIIIGDDNLNEDFTSLVVLTESWVRYSVVANFTSISDGTVVLDLRRGFGDTVTDLHAWGANITENPNSDPDEAVFPYVKREVDPVSTTPTDIKEWARLNFATFGEGFEDYESDLSVTYPSPGHGVDGTTVLGFTGAGTVFPFDADSPVSPDERYDTGMVTNIGQVRGFRVDVPNGTYLVQIVGGHPFQTYGPQRMTVNGEVVWDNLVTQGGTWRDVTVEVEVTNARLQFEFGFAGGGNSVLNFLFIRRVEVLGLFDDGTPAYQIT